LSEEYKSIHQFIAIQYFNALLWQPIQLNKNQIRTYFKKKIKFHCDVTAYQIKIGTKILINKDLIKIKVLSKRKYLRKKSNHQSFSHPRVEVTFLKLKIDYKL